MRHVILTAILLVPAVASGNASATEPQMLSSRATLLAAPDARVEVLPRTQWTISGKPIRAHQLLLREGRLEMKVEKDSSPATEVRVVGDKLVEVPSARSDGHAILVRSPKGQTALLQRGLADVSVHDGHLSVVLHEGQAMAGAGGVMTPLPASHGRSFGCKAGAARALLDAPAWQSGERVWMSADAPARPRTLSWEPVSDAQGYRVRVLRDGQAIFDKNVPGTTLEDRAPELEPGKYDVTVQPLDECGIPGKISEPARIHVVGVDLSEGGYVDDTGIVRTLVGTKVRLTHSEDLFVGYPDVDTWVPFRSEVTLRRDQEMPFYLKSRDGQPTMFRAAPRDIEASVEIGPKNVRWPNQNVDMVVRVHRRGGESAPEWVQPEVKVMLGTRPLDVPWTRQGEELRGTIPSQPGQGPCVVRVEVVDQYGVVLGRNFLEVARGPG